MSLRDLIEINAKDLLGAPKTAPLTERAEAYTADTSNPLKKLRILQRRPGIGKA
jgi:hypothetical protein